MPIYAYKCASCGFAKDVLQKISEAPLTVCPSCGESALREWLPSAGFQRKGSGWYVTDFRDGGKGASAGAGTSAAADGAVKSDAPAPAPAPAASPAPASGGSSGSGSAGS